MGTVSTLPPGAVALDYLGRRVDELRGRSALAPALVVCSSTVQAVGLRRALARRASGLAGVSFTTATDLAASLARPILAQTAQRPARKAELLAAIRAELRAGPGRFGAVADHRTTEERLAALHQELVGLPDDVLDRLAVASQGLSSDALRVVGGASDRLDLDRDPVDQRGGEPPWPCSGTRVLDLALERLAELPTMGLGPIVLFFPEPIRPYEGRLIQALARRSDCDVLVGLTGIAAFDEPHLRRLAAWSIQVDGPPIEQPNGAATVLEVSDPEEEVRAALREVSAHAAAGVSLTELAVLYTTAEPYATLLADQLDAAGLPWSGPGHRSLANSLAGRTLRRLLALATRGLEREAVMTLLASAPIDDSTGHEVPAALWDRLSRQAGVIDGEHWVPRLSELAGSSETDESKQATVALAGFVEGLAADLRPPTQRSWRAWARWASSLLERYLLLSGEAAGPDSQTEAGSDTEVGSDTEAGPEWPEDERRSLGELHQLLDRLADLDLLGLEPTLDTFEATVLAELSGVVMPGRRLGTGLFIGPLSSAVGLGFERVAIVGLAEGLFPRIPREDSLLPDQLRAAGAGMLIDKSAVTDVDTRLVAMAVVASRRPALLLTARGDLRSNRSRSWPRMLDPLVDGRQSLASHHRGLVDHGRPLGIEDLGLRSLITHVDTDNPVQTHELARVDPVLAANLRRADDRRRGDLNPHVGRVAAAAFDPVERLLSPTALETFAACPRKYLFQRVLRLGEDERPERIDEITARDRGTLLHRILERFIGEALADGAIPVPGEPWPAERRTYLIDLLDQELKLAQARGVTGGLVKTRLLRRSLFSELLSFLSRDDALRAERQATPYAAEFSFGQRGTPPLEGRWAGRQMQLRGTVDRIDTTADGGILVIDYKGGSNRPFEGMEMNPLDDGRRLQLPLYARAVAEHLGLEGDRAGIYWLTKSDELREMVLDEELESEVERAVGAALDGIGQGLFPGVPGEVVGWPRLSFENCRYCDFDRICPTDRQGEWDRIRHDPALRAVEVLLGPGPETGEAKGGRDGR